MHQKEVTQVREKLCVWHRSRLVIYDSKDALSSLQSKRSTRKGRLSELRHGPRRPTSQHGTVTGNAQAVGRDKKDVYVYGHSFFLNFLYCSMRNNSNNNKKVKQIYRVTDHGFSSDSFLLFVPCVVQSKMSPGRKDSDALCEGRAWRRVDGLAVVSTHLCAPTHRSPVSEAKLTLFVSHRHGNGV